MAGSTNHPDVVQPADVESTIWRYIDFTKFVYLITQQSLFFCRSDLLGDPFEGSCPAWDVEMRRLRVYKAWSADTLKTDSEFRKWLRGWTYANCWHMNQDESAAMWRLYAQSQEAIAIKTSYKKFLSVLPQEAIVGLVRYLDYETKLMPEGDSALLPFFHKRKSFKHEQEVRAVIQEIPHNSDLHTQNPELGKSVPIDMKELIEKIYVAPMSPQWYFDLVKEIAQTYRIPQPVRSPMDRQPIY
jgi:hypothetical protein